MSGAKTDRNVVKAYETDEGDGARVRRLFPSPTVRDMDPFVLLDEFELEPPAGFPDHTHRGFEAVTYMLEGEFHHKDDMGNDSIVGPGGAQRFTAGNGIVHSEMPHGVGKSRGLQLWINLPKGLKGSSPTYQQVDAGSIPEKRGESGSVRTIIGEGSPVEVHTPVRYLDVRLDPWGTYVDSIPRDWIGLVFVLEGRVTMEGRDAGEGEAVPIEPGGSFMVAALKRPARLVLLAGRPIGEPIVHNGSSVD